MNTYGLLGKNISYSFSEKYFREKFESQNITNVQYLVFDLNSLENLKKDLFERTNLRGFNVTTPYKEKIINFLDELSPIAREIGAVNTVKIENGKKIGYNTDAHGFEVSLSPFLKKQKHENALVLGTGGASKAILYVLKKLKIKAQIVSRNPTENQISYLDINQEILENHTLVINCSPVGTFPKVDEAPEISYEFISDKHLFYDLVYNPEKTSFLSKAEEKGATIIGGYAMLVGQAEKAWEIWNEQKFQRESNTKLKIELIEKLNQLNKQNLEDVVYYNQFLDLIKKWKNTGYPIKEKTHQINTDYHKAYELCLEKINQSPGLVALHQKQNLLVREEILKTLENWNTDQEFNLGYHKEWLYLKSKWEKSASPVSLEDQIATQERWDTLSLQLEKRKQEILEKKSALYNQNKDKKLALLQEIQAFVSHENKSGESWKNKSEKFEKLSSEFKSIGPVLAKDSSKLWKEYLSLQSQFIKEKNQFYKELKVKIKESENAKKELIEKALLASKSTDSKQAAITLKELQQRWKESGVLPKKQGQKLWEDFQKICNEFFQQKNSSTQNTKPLKDHKVAKEKLFLELQNENFDLQKEKQIELLNQYNLKWFALKDSKNADLDQNFKTFLHEKANQLNLSAELEKHNQLLQKSKPTAHTTDKSINPKKNLSQLIQEKSRLENNLSFFVNSSRDNPLLVETHKKLAQLEAEIELIKKN